MSKSLVLIDGSNVFTSLKTHSWTIDFKKFFNWLNKEYNTIGIYFYGGIISKKAFFDKNQNTTKDQEEIEREFIAEANKQKNFQKLLRDIGYIVKSKPVSSVFDKELGKHRYKCNFDVEIAIDALDKINDYEELVLCSGDGDFVKLLKYIKGKHMRTTVISYKNRLNFELKRTADNLVCFCDIEDNIKRLEHKKIGSP